MKLKMLCYIVYYLSVSFSNLLALGLPQNIAWNGGPMHLECDHSADLFTHSGQYISENVIAIKAVTFKDEIYVITPRLKRGVPATVWVVVRGRRGTELQAFPDMRAHAPADCRRIQNAVDIHLDYLGNLWVLDSGLVETLEHPRCTCPPKVVMISTLLKKVTRSFDLSRLTEPTSLLQNVVVEYGMKRKPFLYISDASRGAVLVVDTSTESEWSVAACAPVAGLQLALARRAPAHAVLVLTRLHHPGVLELDTAALRRRKSLDPLRVFGAHTKPVVLLGSDAHHIYLRHSENADVLSWDTRAPFNETRLRIVHSPGPHLTPTSVAADPLKQYILVLESNYADTVHGKSSTYHRITFIGQL